MKLTIDIKEFCRSEANTYKAGLSEKISSASSAKPSTGQQ